MTIRVVCPSCRQVYHLDESKQNKTVLCRECQAPIAVGGPDRPQRREEERGYRDDRIASSSRSEGSPGRVRRDEEDEPRRRPDDRLRDREPPAERDRGLRSTRSRRREEEEPQGNTNMVPIFIGIGAGAVVLLGLLIGGVVIAARSVSGGTEKAVAGDPLPGAGGVGQAMAQVAAPAREPEVPLPAGPVPVEMPANVVQQVKQSTAYLRVHLPTGGMSEGSGFFALERGIVITNAHVIGMLRGGLPPRSVEVVTHSGEPGETRLTGTVMGVDQATDLAVLRVEGDASRLPAPLPVDSATKLTETQKVYIFGFPFGADLGKNITVSTSTVTSLRRENGVLTKVQVNGGMHPGNSGGPVTDARGAVVGVSVSGIRGTQINFAIPGDFIRPVIERARANPGRLMPPGPVVQPDRPAPFRPAAPGMPAGPAPGAGLAGDAAALRGTWTSGRVRGDSPGASGTLRLHVMSRAGSASGRIHVDVAVTQRGRRSSSRSTYNFTLREEDGHRLLVATGGPRGTGIVFIYRFANDRLIVSGKVVSLNVTFALGNISLDRKSAVPEDNPGDGPAIPGLPPAPANPARPGRPGRPAMGGGQGAADALRFTGDVYSFVQTAVQENRLTDVDIRGFTLGKDHYRDVCEEGGVLIGFQVGLGKFVNNEVLKSWRPIYRTKNGEKFGRWQGKVPTSPVTVKARDGYVVSGILVRSGLGIDAITLTFAKLGTDKLDLNDTYNSQQIGGNGGGVSTIGGKGALFVGVTGNLSHDKSPCSLGLVAVLPKK
jgi:S1-C subfamily serine protease